MTYCLGMLCRTGAVFLSDSRTSAGMDNITMRSKMRVYEKPGERVICIMTSGNLSLTQATLALIDDDLILANNEPASETIMTTQTLYETARYVGTKVRAVEKRDRVALEADGFDFNINLIVGGQIAGLTPEIHLIYPQGNSIHATRDCPFLQIGETKYGKPILDRGFNYETSLSDAVKFGIISIDATMKSNVAVGPPIDLLCYELDSLVANLRMRLDEDDPYLQEIGRKWQNGIVKLVKDMPAPDFTKPFSRFRHRCVGTTGVCQNMRHHKSSRRRSHYLCPCRRAWVQFLARKRALPCASKRGGVDHANCPIASFALRYW